MAACGNFIFIKDFYFNNTENVRKLAIKPGYNF